jgi:hypothetical protein
MHDSAAVLIAIGGVQIVLAIAFPFYLLTDVLWKNADMKVGTEL